MVRALAVDRLSVHYAGARSPALMRFTFDLIDGGSVAVLGPAGAGKTTFLQAVAGLLHAQEHSVVEGSVRVLDSLPHDRSTMTAFPAVSVLPQDPRHIISGFVPTVADELHLTLRQARIPEDQWSEAVDRIVGEIPIAHLLSRPPSTLSGGEMQSVALAIAAVAQPRILCLDEPATSLDQGRVNELTRFILSRPPDMAVILADTSLHAPALACDRVVVLDHGTAVFSDAREAFWQRLPEFQDLVSLGSWIDVWHQRSRISDQAFRTLLERAC